MTVICLVARVVCSTWLEFVCDWRPDWKHGLLKEEANSKRDMRSIERIPVIYGPVKRPLPRRC